MKKIIKLLVVIIATIFLISPISFGSEINLKEQIKKENGSLFEKIIAECIGGIAQTVFDFSTSKQANVGFKDYDTLIFNNNVANDNLSPFNQELWNKTMIYYKIFGIISSSLIFIAVIILSYKMITAGVNIQKKNEAKDSLLRLLLGAVFILLAPMFIRFLLYINNSFVHLLITSVKNNSLDGFLGNSMLTSIKTGNAITTALVISMFIYLFVKLNIKFIIRQFTIIIFTIFTPVACGLWIINKNVTAASIWAGQIIMNIFMQFIYCFLFLIYLTFLPSGGGWAISLIWAMMILPLADTLQNCLQNLTSRIAGIDNEQMTNRVMGMSAMLGFGVGAIKEQFKTPNSKSVKTNNGENNSNNGLQGLITRAKSIINPGINLSAEKDYNGNVNPIRENLTPTQNVKLTKDTSQQIKTPNENVSKTRSLVTGIAKAGYVATKSYLQTGANLAEGNFEKNNSFRHNTNTHRKMQTTEYTNKLSERRTTNDESNTDSQK